MIGYPRIGQESNCGSDEGLGVVERCLASSVVRLTPDYEGQVARPIMSKAEKVRQTQALSALYVAT